MHSETTSISNSHLSAHHLSARGDHLRPAKVSRWLIALLLFTLSQTPAWGQEASEDSSACDTWQTAVVQDSLARFSSSYEAALKADPQKTCTKLPEVIVTALSRAESFAYLAEIDKAKEWFRLAHELSTGTSAQAWFLDQATHSPATISATTANTEQQEPLPEAKPGPGTPAKNEGPEAVRRAQDALRDAIFAKALELAELGLHSAALTELKAAVGLYPWAEVPPNLEYLSGGPGPWWRAARRWLDSWLSTAPEVPLLIALFLLLCVRQLRSPLLKIEDPEGDALSSTGQSFSTMLRDHLLHLSRGTGGSNVQQVTGPVEPTAIPTEIETVVPGSAAWLKAIGALLKHVRPRRLLHLSIQAHTSETRGVGITLQLLRAKKILTSQTLWQQDFRCGKLVAQPNGEVAFRLAEYASIWLLFELCHFVSGQQLELLGTQDWRSYALCRAALHASDPKHKRKLFLQALDRDPDFRMAKVNLASNLVQQQRSTSSSIDLRTFAIGLLQSVVQEVTVNQERTDGTGASRPIFATVHDPTYLTALYLLVVLQHETEELIQALRTAKALNAELDAARSALESAGNPRLLTQRNLVTYLRHIEPSARLVHSTLLLLNSPGTLEEAHKLLSALPAASSSAYVQYSFACSYSLVAEKCSRDEACQMEQYLLGQALEHLGRALSLSEEVARSLNSDPTLEHVRTSRKSAEAYQALIDRFPAVTPQENESDS